MSSPDQLTATLSDRGFTTAPLLDAHEITKLRSAFERLGLRPDHGFFSSNAHSSRATASRLHRDITSIVEPAIRRLLPDHRAFLGAFISKGAHYGHPVQLHQDWTYTDERVHRAVAVWIPLVDVDRDNGVLELVPGSHRGDGSDLIRPSGAGNPLANDLTTLQRRAEYVDLEAGTAVLYDPAVAHGSQPNVTTDIRPAVAVAFAPENAELVHFHLDPWHRLRGFRVDTDYFTAQTFAGCPVGYPETAPWAAIRATRSIKRRFRPVNGGIR